MHLKTTTYIRCLIDMSLYKNFNEETKADVMWKKINVMFENKNVVKRVSIFQKIVRLRYQDGSSMEEHLNSFQGLTNQTTSLEVPLADKVLALLLFWHFLSTKIKRHWFSCQVKESHYILIWYHFRRIKKIAHMSLIMSTHLWQLYKCLIWIWQFNWCVKFFYTMELPQHNVCDL